MPTLTLPDKGVCRVRAATGEDIPALVELGLEFLAQPPYDAMVTPNQIAMAQSVAAVIDLGSCFVGESKGQILSMIGLMLHDNPWSGERVASELFWFSSRLLKGCLGIKLLTFAEQWAREQGAVEMHMISPDPRIGKVYTRRGYVPAEQLYRRRF